MDKRIFEILSHKPELVTNFPDWMLSESIKCELKNTANLGIAEIAGRDSFAAVIKAVYVNNIKAILPTIAYTGTEYGNWEVPLEKITLLKKTLSTKNIKLYDPILIGSPRFWHLLCGRYASCLFKRFGFYSPCVSCHLYFHAVRIPLAKIISCTTIIAGEREAHDKGIKINQIPCVLDRYESFVKKFNVALLLPLRHIELNADIASLVGSMWDEKTEQIACVMEKNYLNETGRVIYDEESIKRFFDEFALHIADDMVEQYLSQI